MDYHIIFHFWNFGSHVEANEINIFMCFFSLFFFCASERV